MPRGAWRGGEPPGRLGTMRRLALSRPWSFLIVRPDVTDPAEWQRHCVSGHTEAIENRSWRPPAGYWGSVAIHDGKTCDEAIDDRWLHARIVSVTLLGKMVAGAIVCVAR